MDDSGEIIIRSICEACWYQNERISYNINGRCDSCGCTSFIDAGHILDDTKEIEINSDDLPGMWESSDFLDGDSDERSYRERALDAVAEIRDNPRYANPLSRKERFYHGTGGIFEGGIDGDSVPTEG